MTDQNWGIERGLKDIAEAIGVPEGVDTEPISDALESIDEHLVELAEGLRADMATLIEAVQVIGSELAAMNAMTRQTKGL
jgi:hypothetical protein